MAVRFLPRRRNPWFRYFASFYDASHVSVVEWDKTKGTDDTRPEPMRILCVEPREEAERLERLCEEWNAENADQEQNGGGEDEWSY